MKISGFRALSLIDYPDKLSAIIWTYGCNFRCPFCYNIHLVMKGRHDEFMMDEEDIFRILDKRKEHIDGVVITGGEPLLHDDIDRLCKRIKDLSLLVKIDTNGSNPDRLKELIDRGLIDYIAMDIKAPIDKYKKKIGEDINIKNIFKSIDIIRNSGTDYELRTTLVPTILDTQDIIDISDYLSGAKRYVIQQFENTNMMIDTSLMDVEPYSDKYIDNIYNIIKDKFDECIIRGT